MADYGRHIKKNKKRKGENSKRNALLCKQVQVVLLRVLVPLPRAAAEVAAPVCWRQPGPVGSIARRLPDVPVPLGVVPGRPRLLEPRVLGRRVVDHQVEDQPHAAGMACVDERLHVLERPVRRVHGLVIGDVVAHVDLRTLKHRRDPHNVDPEILQVVHLADDARNVAQAVTVAVFEAGRVDLVGRALLPPCILRRRRRRHGGDVALAGVGPGAESGSGVPIIRRESVRRSAFGVRPQSWLYKQIIRSQRLGTSTKYNRKQMQRTFLPGPRNGLARDLYRFAGFWFLG